MPAPAPPLDRSAGCGEANKKKSAGGEKRSCVDARGRRGGGLSEAVFSLLGFCSLAPLFSQPWALEPSLQARAMAYRFHGRLQYVSRPLGFPFSDG